MQLRRRRHRDRAVPRRRHPSLSPGSGRDPGPGGRWRTWRLDRHRGPAGRVASDQVVDAVVRTVRSTATMALTESGVWKLIRSQAVAIDDGVTGCWTGTDFPY